ncbi:YheT family hydrolase [Neisseriaceae bacterium B1]
MDELDFSYFVPSELSPPRWLNGGNWETVYAKLLQSVAPHYRRELILDSFGEDLVAYDFVDAADKHAPCVVLLHGLEGGSMSHYAVELMLATRARGWHGVVPHFRSCGGVTSRRLYHSGDSPEVAHMLQVLSERYACLLVVGVSLGGNVLAKYLGEQGDKALPRAAAVVSSPVRLAAAGDALEKGLPRLLYTPYFLRTLMSKVEHSGEKLRSLAEFDNRFTAPIHGFLDKDDYYARASAMPFLRNVAVPTLLLNARNDPFFPEAFLPTRDEVSGSVLLLQPERGGHVGFVSGTGRGHLRWLPENVLRFFEGWV